ncbi:MAG: hypothetical protein JWL73_2582 [Actinomycetia bacterium]|nr:hypothetical protein [Actinomycetes bacterium]
MQRSKAKQPSKKIEQFEWKIVSAASAALAGLVSRRILLAAWARFAPGDPPDSPEDPAAPMRQALAWAVATGVGLGVARILAVRGAAKVWERAAHEPPPTR